MAELIATISSHPYGDTVTLLAFLSALAFLQFLWGFTGYILAHGDKEHQAHARTQMVQGMFAFLVVFSIWETVRGGIAFFENAALPTFALIIILIWVVAFLYTFAKKQLKGGGGGH